jgi:hypothetical protein
MHSLYRKSTPRRAAADEPDPSETTIAEISFDHEIRKKGFPSVRARIHDLLAFEVCLVVHVRTLPQGACQTFGRRVVASAERYDAAGRSWKRSNESTGRQTANFFLRGREGRWRVENLFQKNSHALERQSIKGDFQIRVLSTGRSDPVSAAKAL